MEKTSLNGRVTKRKVKGFTQVSNAIARDEDLSMKAIGLYVIINSYLTNPEWTLYKSFLMKHCKEGQKAFNSGWKELKEAGYLIQYKLKNQKGVYYYEYELLDEPEKPSNDADLDPHTQKDTMDLPDPQNGSMDNGSVEKVGVDKGGLNKYLDNNTNSNNTNRIEQNSIDKYDEIINKAKDSETEQNCSDLSEKDEVVNFDKPIIIPKELEQDLDKFFIKRLKMERKFFGLDFNDSRLYNVFCDALVKTQMQDDIEILTIPQYAYFSETLKRMLDILKI